MSPGAPTSCPTLPAAVGRTLARLGSVRPVEADAAAEALSAALAPVAASSWPEVAWRASTLTGTGLPVELAWASRDTALRWTCEVSGPEVAEADRLGRCVAAARAVAGSDLDLGAWTGVQRGRPLRWGTWLGVRHRGTGRAAKAYVELPPGAAVPAPWSSTAASIRRRVPGLAWRMAGVNDDGSVELYARVPELTPAALGAVAGVVGDGQGLTSTVEALLAAPGPLAALPRPSGVSVVMTADGTPLAVTWFSFAKAVWSSDARAGAAVTRLLKTGVVPPADGSTDLYRALGAGEDDGRWRHGMVGVGVDVTGATWLQAGLRPT